MKEVREGLYIGDFTDAAMVKAAEVLPVSHVLSLVAGVSRRSLEAVHFMLPALSQITTELDGCRALVFCGGHKQIVQFVRVATETGGAEARAPIVDACDTLLNLLIKQKDGLGLPLSDLFFWANESLAHTFPRIFGHEAAGIVESVGEGVTDLRPGDHVIPVFTGECRECKYCASPKTNLCAKFGVASFETGMRSYGKSSFSVQGKPVFRFLGSTFSEYTVVEYAYVVKINPAAPLDKVCLLGCGVTAGIGAVRKIAQMESGATVAVFGLGTVGLSVVEEAELEGASRIIGVDNKASKADEGKRFWITDFLNPDSVNKPVDEEIRELTGGGVDLAFECVGNPNVMASAFESCQDGTMIVIGVAGRASVTIPTRYLLSGRCMKGTLYGGYKPKTDLPELVEQYL